MSIEYNGKKLFLALKGAKGDTGAKLVSQVLQGQDENGGNVYLQTFDDGTTATFTAPCGSGGGSISKGDGEYSTVTLEDEDRGNEANGRANISAGHKNKTYQRDSFAFGGGNQSGMTYQEWIDAGNSGTEEDWQKSYGFEFTMGASNKNLGRAAVVGGEDNYNTGDHSLLVGRGLYNTGEKSVLLGGEDGLGYNKTSTCINNGGKNNFFFGRYLRSRKDNNDINKNNVILLGETLCATNDNQVIVGKNSGDNYNGRSDLRFAVGCGTTPEKGFNGLEVYENGIVNVICPPVSPNGVVRLEDLNNALSKLNGGGEKLCKHTITFTGTNIKLIIYSTDNTPFTQGINPEENTCVWAQAPEGFMDTIRNAYIIDEYNTKYQCNIAIGETNIPNILKLVGYYSFGSLTYETIFLPQFKGDTVTE